MKKRKYSFLNLLLWSLSALLVLMAGAGLLLGVWNVGSTGLLLTAAVLAATAVVRRWKKRRGWMMTTIALLLVAGLVLHAAVWNYFAYGRPAPKQGAATVVVLGCKVNGDQPSLMLRRRLECALEYLRANEQAVCVVSGGQGSNESYSEAYVMEKFLVENGVAPERVEQEALSTNTDSNIANSLQLIEQKGLPHRIILCTDGFHQLRAWMYLQRHATGQMADALHSTAISGRTPAAVVPSYAMRELFGILKLLLVG